MMIANTPAHVFGKTAKIPYSFEDLSFDNLVYGLTGHYNKLNIMCRQFKLFCPTIF